jgi:hypothetical protein
VYSYLAEMLNQRVVARQMINGFMKSVSKAERNETTVRVHLTNIYLKALMIHELRLVTKITIKI